jgi:hypothetical protein
MIGASVQGLDGLAAEGPASLGKVDLVDTNWNASTFLQVPYQQQILTL